MKITMLKEKLIQGLSIIERIADKNLTLPILNNVLLTTNKNFLNLSTTNLEIAAKYWGLAKIEEEGETTVPVKLLLSFISSIEDEKITLESKKDILYIKGKSYETQIKGLNPEEFPIIPKIEKEKFIEINNLLIQKGISQVVDLCSSGQVRPELSGVYFNFQKNRIKIVATDSFRLAEKTLYLEGAPSYLFKENKEYSFILPHRAAKEFVNIFSEREGKLKICFSPNQILFELPFLESPHPQIQLISRLIEGEYPDYQEIIPKSFKTQVILSKDKFLNQIKIASYFCGKINEVKFKIDPQKGTMEIFSQNPDLGENKSFILGKIEGKKIEVSFNFRFLLDGVSNIKSQELIFELNGEEGPAVLKPVGDASYIYIIMPVKAS